MHDISMIIQYPDRGCEVLPDNPTLAECQVEELISHVLSTLFQVVLIEEVSLLFPRPHTRHRQPIKLSLHALGCDPLSPIPPDLLAHVIKDRLSCALVELLGSFNVERFAVR